MSEPRRVLIAAMSVQSGSGTDLYTRDLALGLLRRGWLPIVYATMIGSIGQELRHATIPVVDDLAAIATPPDVIHGHQVLETIAALLRFPNVPALFVSHGALAWSAIPPATPRIGAYVAVDRNCRDRMAFEHGIPAERIRILFNAVDLRRFRRRAPLPERPRRALVFSNEASENTWAAPIREACERRGIALDLAGAASGRQTSTPEELLPQYDLVFAKARCALEALTTGNAVIACDHAGLGGLIGSSSLDEMRALNFGARTLQRAITADAIGAEIDRYDATDAARVTDRIRATADLELLLDQYIALYEELMATPVLDDTRQLALTLARVAKPIYETARVRRSPIRAALRNSRMLGLPARLLWRWIKR
ncbi:MAG TPA: glycosyltransferase [Thermoanaerobaculia bacterium]|nr:glycosyltransferase [Thermoanaerobaculia bacterium]